MPAPITTSARLPEPGPQPDRQNLLEQVLENPRLPTPPALALQIVEKAGRADCSIREITALLRQDPGLCGQLLKTVNSSVYGLAKPVASIERTAVLLGIKPLRSLVLGLSLPAIQTKGTDPSVWKYWQESVSGAVIARELAVLLHRQDPDDYLVASLLRDVGSLVLRELFPADYEKVAQACVSDAEQRQQEDAVFGVRHEEVSAAVLESWRLPPEIVEPVRCHHEPDALASTVTKATVERTWIVHIADQLARGKFGTGPALHGLMQLADKHLGLSPRALSDFLRLVVPKITDFAGILKVDIGQVPNFGEIILSGAQELVKLAVETNKPPHVSSVNRPANQAASPPAVSDPTPLPGRLIPAGLPSTPASPDRGSDRGMGHGSDQKRQAGGRAAPTMGDFELSGMDQLPEAGTVLNGYEIREVLGRGAMGVVFKAYDPSLRRYAAVKMLTPERVVSSEARERFKREARAAAAVQHANIVTIYAVSEINGLPYLVMEYVAGVSLQQRLDSLKTLPIADIVSYARQIALGLGFAHRQGIVHRDIKPANILLQAETDDLKITDFGLARIESSGHGMTSDVDLSSAGGWVGTPLFMAPEQFDSSAVDFRADLFSFGAVLYYLTTGKTPFMADSVPALMRQVCERRPTSPRILRPETPTWLDTLIMKLLQKSPSARGASALEVERYIRRYEVLVRT